MRPFPAFLVPALLIGLAAVVPLRAQTPTAGPVTTGTAPPAATTDQPPTPAELIERMDTLRARLDEIDALIASPQPLIASVRAALPDLDREVSAALRSTLPARLENVSELDLRIEQQNLARLSRRLDVQRKQLQPLVSSTEPLRAALKDDLEFLVEARIAGVDDELPEVLRAQLPALEQRAQRLRISLRDRLNQPVALLERINRLDDQVEARSAALKQTITRRERALLTLSAPPLWQTFGQPTHTGLNDILGRDVSLMLRNGADYVESFAPQLVVFALIYAGMLFAAIRLRRYVPDAPGSTPAAKADLVLTRPVLVVTLIWAILGPELLLPELPPGLGVVRGVVALTGLALVVPAYAGASAVVPLRALLLVTLLAIMEQALLGDALYGRTLSIILALVAIVLFRRIPVQPDGSLLRSFAGYLCRFAPPLLALGALAELVGAEGLGGEVVTGVLFAAVLVTAFLVADMLIGDLLRLMVQGPLAEWSRAVRRNPDLVRRRVGFVLRLLLVVTFIAVIPRVITVVDPLWEAVAAFFAQPIGIGAISLAPADLLRFAIGVLLAVALARSIRFLLDGDLLPRMAMSRGVQSTVSRLSYYTILIAGLLFAFAAAGLQFSQLALVVSALGVGIGFGLQNVVSNFVSGLIIAFEQPFREGDLIEVANVSGVVEEIGLRASRLRSPDGAEMIVPNATLLSGELTNWTLSDRARRIEIAVSVAHGTDPRQVQAVLRESVKDLPGIAAYPEPNVAFRGFGPGSLDFGLLLWTADVDDRLNVEGEARVRVLAALRAAGIEIPLPRMDVRLEGPLPSATAGTPPVAG